MLRDPASDPGGVALQRLWDARHAQRRHVNDGVDVRSGAAVEFLDVLTDDGLTQRATTRGK